jgi:hypothetical protein
MIGPKADAPPCEYCAISQSDYDYEIQRATEWRERAQTAETLLRRCREADLGRPAGVLALAAVLGDIGPFLDAPWKPLSASADGPSPSVVAMAMARDWHDCRYAVPDCRICLGRARGIDKLVEAALSRASEAAFPASPLDPPGSTEAALRVLGKKGKAAWAAVGGVIDDARAAAFEQALAAIKGERLDEKPDNPGDEGYEHALDDAEAAVARAAKEAR